MMRVRVNLLDWPLGAEESTTVTVYVAGTVLAFNGVPLMIPGPSKLKNNPLGNAGETDHVYGGIPPVASTWIVG